MAFTLVNNIMAFFTHNWIMIILVLVVLFLGYKFIKSSGKVKPKIINRSEIERNNYITRNKLNLTRFKWLYRGNDCIGEIKQLRYSKLEELKPCMEFIIKPLMFDFIFKLSNPLSRNMIMLVFDDRNLILNMDKKEIEEQKNNGFVILNPIVLDTIDKKVFIDERITFDYLYGIYYDRRLEDTAINYIKDTNVFRTDWDNFASVYFAKSQEQSTFNPEYAHEVIQKQQEIDLEEKKRLHRTT